MEREIEKVTPGYLKKFIPEMTLEIKYLIYMYEKDSTLNNRQWLLWHYTKLNQTKSR